MKAAKEILEVWRAFDHFPMETLTKAWYLQSGDEPKQRSVDLMKMHREQYGTSGNCFDLALWLLEELRQNKMDCYGIVTPDDHVAVIVLGDQGQRYLCDLGDQWIQPVLIERGSKEYTEDWLRGFFPGSEIKVQVQQEHLDLTYKRPNGKESKQTYLLTPVSDAELTARGEQTQKTLRRPLVEQRLFSKDEVTHWEFDDYSSFHSTMNGKVDENALDSIEEWAHRIHSVTGMSRDVIIQALEVYGI
ncbi:hypothetical protein [Paenibacillus lemnae]|uniref:Arylamine N-acetyltransferase n=1 Tax=Paenibacillus lemnae TaxID=1330551 RepID=A0A848MA52_PAELE|nr:hypothetical protein [Paenibacillus lemnae]NMO97040.1 hypothetical protein [Paenibacillus lemnae]